MKEIKFENEVIKVLEASGYNDGYYWDMNAKIEYKGDTYSLFDGGSGSGYNLCCTGIIKCEFDRLFGEEQGDIEEDEWDYLESCIINTLSNFIEAGAKESWEMQQDDNFDFHTFVDGIEVENEES